MGMEKIRRRFVSLLIVAVMLFVSAYIGLGYGNHASAEPDIIGNPNGSTSRALISDGQSVRRIVYVESGVKTMANTTPVASQPDCSGVGTLHRADVVLVGTMSGTAPTLAIKWQNSVDGVTWNDVGTWTTINATVTPASQSQVVSDINASTAVAFGPCWRTTYAFGGSGTVTANFKIIGVDK